MVPSEVPDVRQKRGVLPRIPGPRRGFHGISCWHSPMDLCWLSRGLSWVQNSILRRIVLVSTGVVVRKVGVRLKIPFDHEFSVFLADIHPWKCAVPYFDCAGRRIRLSIERYPFWHVFSRAEVIFCWFFSAPGILPNKYDSYGQNRMMWCGPIAGSSKRNSPLKHGGRLVIENYQRNRVPCFSAHKLWEIHSRAIHRLKRLC